MFHPFQLNGLTVGIDTHGQINWPKTRTGGLPCDSTMDGDPELVFRGSIEPRTPPLEDPIYSGPPILNSDGVHRELFQIWKDDQREWLQLTFDDKRVCFAISADGKSAWLVRSENASDAELRTVFSRIVVAAALVRCGQPLLHGTAIAYRDKAIVLVGASGAGKSTTAARLIDQHGWSLVSDDVCAVGMMLGEAFVRRGEQRLRLHPDAFAYVSGDARDAARVFAYREKRYWSPGRAVTSASTTRLVGVVRVERRRESVGPVLRELHGHEAFQAIWSQRFSPVLGDRGRAVREFQQLADLAAHIAVCTLEGPVELGGVGVDAKLRALTRDS